MLMGMLLLTGAEVDMAGVGPEVVLFRGLRPFIPSQALLPEGLVPKIAPSYSRDSPLTLKRLATSCDTA
jgi:hypothetical protein